jgi:hypothetical protein
VGGVKVELERPAVCAEQSRERLYFKTTTISSSSAIPTCVFFICEGRKAELGVFYLGKVHSAKQAAMVTGAFVGLVCLAYSSQERCEIFWAQCREDEKTGIHTPKASLGPRAFFVVTNVHEKETLRGGDLIIE